MNATRKLYRPTPWMVIAAMATAFLISGCAKQNRVINGTTSGISGSGNGSQDVSAGQPAANASNIQLPSESSNASNNQSGSASSPDPSGAAASNQGQAPDSSGDSQVNAGSVPSFGPDAMASLAPDAPKGEFTTLTGGKINLASLRGQVVLIDFWAPWCPPCRLGLPFTQRLATTFKGKGLTVLAATSEKNSGQSLTNIKNFIKGNQYTLTVAFDLNAKFADEMKITGLPTIFVLDRKGKVVGREVGLHPQTETIDNLKKAGLEMGSFAPKDDPLDGQ